MAAETCDTDKQKSYPRSISVWLTASLVIATAIYGFESPWSSLISIALLIVSCIAFLFNERFTQYRVALFGYALLGFFLYVASGIGFLVCLASATAPQTSAISLLMSEAVRASAVHWWSIAVYALGTAVCEETIFRKWTTAFFEKMTGSAVWAIVISSTLFGLSHGTRFFIAFLFGVLMSLVMRKARCLLIPIAIHAFHDFLYLGVETFTASIRMTGDTPITLKGIFNAHANFAESVLFLVLLVIAGYSHYKSGKSLRLT
ncbi:MAG: CPBP family intramembrane metalloprotease [Herminiimonas sp.]|nr:CPBP family intramembrane metalloprotease [Herminiimonas sp.]